MNAGGSFVSSFFLIVKANIEYVWSVVCQTYNKIMTEGRQTTKAKDNKDVFWHIVAFRRKADYKNE